MFVVGLTGGIGSGKTAVSDRFAALGIDIVDADVVGRVIMDPGRPAFREIVDHFGEDIVKDDGRIDRAALRRKVFADPAERRWLERLTHPLIGRELREGIEGARSPYVLLVNPIMIESGGWRRTNRLLVVDVPEDLQIRRTMKRDANTEAEVRNIIAAQASRERRLELADDVIVNDGELEALDPQVDALHTRYLELARQSA
jgi:dephospho-CoA kinase